MDTNTDAIKERLQRIAADAGIQLERIVLFGSRIRGDNRPQSDIDIILVSPDFQNTSMYKRPVPFYKHWPYDALPDPEFICLTPAEFQEQKERKPHIVRTAVETGIEEVVEG